MLASNNPKVANAKPRLVKWRMIVDDGLQTHFPSNYHQLHGQMGETAINWNQFEHVQREW